MPNAWDDLVENCGWSYGGDAAGAHPFTLAASTDHYQFSNTITELGKGEFMVFNFKVLKISEPGKFDRCIEIDSRMGENTTGWEFAAFNEGLLCLFHPHAQDWEDKKEYNYFEYQVGQSLQVVVTHRSRGSNAGELNLYVGGVSFHQSGRMMTSGQERLPIFTKVVGMEVQFFG